MSILEPTVLKTLPERQFSAGTAELIKHGFIKNKTYTNFIQEQSEKIMAQNDTAMEEVIYQSCQIKRNFTGR
mgnify:CR=1 FL=1